MVLRLKNNSKSNWTPGTKHFPVFKGGKLGRMMMAQQPAGKSSQFCIATPISTSELAVVVDIALIDHP